MRRISIVLVAALLAAGIAPSVRAEDGKTAATTTAEAWFTALRKACTDKDDAVLTVALPESLVSAWPEQAKDEGKPWRAALAEQIAKGKVASVRENGETAVARWTTTSPNSSWELLVHRRRGVWSATSPWAWKVAGGAVGRTGSKDCHVKLEVRKPAKGEPAYGESAYSFTCVTQDMKLCKNRPDVWFCSAGHLHGKNAMLSKIAAKSLDAVDGWQRVGDRMDQIDKPHVGEVYIVNCLQAGKTEFQVALAPTFISKDALEFDWRLNAAGIGAPKDVRKAQPDTSNDGADGTDSDCGAPGK